MNDDEKALVKDIMIMFDRYPTIIKSIMKYIVLIIITIFLSFILMTTCIVCSNNNTIKEIQTSNNETLQELYPLYGDTSPPKKIGD